MRSAAMRIRARLAGIRVDKTKEMIYMCSGLLTGLAAMIFIGRTGAIQPSAGVGYEMDAIGAVVLGGVTFLGGKGSVLGTLLGAILMGLLMNGMTLLKISANYQALSPGWLSYWPCCSIRQEHYIRKGEDSNAEAEFSEIERFLEIWI